MKAQPAGAGGAGKKASNMSVYTVHVPPATAQTAPDPGRFVFVRDGFSFWAFLLGPVWMLWHGMWLVLVGSSALKPHRCDASRWHGGIGRMPVS